MRWDTGNKTTTASAPAEVKDGTQGGHEWRSVDISNYSEVASATQGTDVTIVLSVVRTHPVMSFRVNGQGVYNAIKAAVAAGHERLVNTGPKNDNMFNFSVTEEMPWHTGIGLYSMTKGIGHEIARVFSANHPIHVLTTLHGSFPINDGSGRFEHGTTKEVDEDGRWVHGSGLAQPFCATFPESADCVVRCVTVDLARMPSRHESFFVVGDTPDQTYSNAKAKRLLDWRPQDDISGYWTREPGFRPGAAGVSKL
jgi:hypothetical protein